MSADETLARARRLRQQQEGRPSPAVLRLAAESPCSAYDCEFVALAAELRARLVTFDREILEAFPRVAVSPQRFLEG